MVVSGRSGSEDSARWRVGRRRLAWRPSSAPLEVISVAEGPFVLVVLPVFGWWLASWTASLLATAFVWPARAATGRWPVVAYVLEAENDRFQCRWTRSRAEADTLVQQWKTEIEQFDRPQPGPGVLTRTRKWFGR
ncbi:hypothetical protein [Actinoplanes sp. DH11]|uniref:hypothetical protein n=1 Tax=Actinoplanes sp. DH11 TaxID=2857011 RepID=UPI001E36AA60|nr:hypothetical protein [Actinoplanes sp. DH11]